MGVIDAFRKARAQVDCTLALVGNMPPTIRRAR